MNDSGGDDSGADSRLRGPSQAEVPRNGAASEALPGDVIELARKLSASGQPWFWLDGAAPAAGEPKVSYLGTATEVRMAMPGRELEFLAELREGLADRPPRNCDTGADVRFSDGWVVALGYEFGVGLLGLAPSGALAPGSSEQPELANALALRVTEAFAVRHRDEEPADQENRVLAASQLAGAELRDSHQMWRQDDAAYLDAVADCQAAIREGEAYVLCLTDSARVAGTWDPLELYLRLRAEGGAVRGGVIVTQDRALVSVSPERFLSVHGRQVATHPMKGTRPRAVDPRIDNAYADDLRSDPKERAENLMIVDLMRNDLSRVCELGTVCVDGFLRVERHAHVHQLVSTVTGTLMRDADVFDAVAATFPGGSMTGAPKRRAVEILQAQEAGERGLYSGCFGWIDASGDAELAMTIRGVEIRGRGSLGEIALVGAGGGITADSDPGFELREKQLKARPLLAALAQDPRYS